MKQLFLLLVLINGAFFAWQFYGAQRSGLTVETRSGVSQDKHGIMLLSELEKESEANTSLPVQQQNNENNLSMPAILPDESDKSCGELGPFGKDNARAASDQLKSQGLSIDIRVSREEIFTGYWIFLAETERNIAMKQLAAVKAKGIKDAAIVKLARNRYVVSLGIFSQESSKRRRIRHMELLGFEPQVKEHYRTGEAFWLWLDKNAVDSLPVKQLRRNNQAISLVRRACTDR
ncbi:MAG: hypothetical protein ACE5EH_03170 [Gammaproteobacteria bacterium]